MGNKFFVALGAAVVLVSSSVFTVGETERVLKFQLGEIVATDFQPGMHFKIPLINNVKKFDARILTMDSTPERFFDGREEKRHRRFFRQMAYRGCQNLLHHGFR